MKFLSEEKYVGYKTLTYEFERMFKYCVFEAQHFLAVKLGHWGSQREEKCWYLRHVRCGAVEEYSRLNATTKYKMFHFLDTRGVKGSSWKISPKVE